MKFFLFLFILIFMSEIFCQTPAQNFQKYQYYRQRLVNDYMLVGDCDGCSVPANIRGRTSTPNFKASNVLNWGDATIELGWYISVLATEYKVFTMQGQSTSETIKELYYALRAFNRLDEMAEAYCRCNESSNYDVTPYNNCVSAGFNPQSGDLNGFFIRDDVPANFVSSNTTHFNQNLNASIITATIESSDRTERQDGDPPGSNPNQADLNPVEESVDQVCGMLMGCALVNKFIPAGTSYYGLALNNVDGNTDIQKEARNITHRIVNWIKYSFEINFGIPTPLGTQSYNFDYDFTRWITVNPVNHECVADIGGINHDCGFRAYGNFTLMCYGLAEAANKITGTDYSDAYTSGTAPLWQAYQTGCPTSFSLFGKQIDVSFCDANYYLIAVTAALGNSWIGILGNNTNDALCGWGTNNNYEWLPLLRQVLHGGDNGISLSFYEILLNTAPPTGPYKFSSTDFPSLIWSATNTLRQPDRRGTGSLQFLGEYYGMDYMLLHNLYIISSEPPLPTCTIFTTGQFDAGGIFEDLDFSDIFNNTGFVKDDVVITTTTINNDQELHVKNSITTSGTVKITGNVYWTAPVIEFNPGTTLENGTYEAKECNELFGRLANPDTKHKGGSFDSASNPLYASANSASTSIQKENVNNAKEEFINGSNLSSGNQDSIKKIIRKDGSEIQFQHSEAISISPNPSQNGKFSVNCTLNNIGCMEAEFTVFDALGQRLQNSPIKHYYFPTEIDLSELTKGIYFIKIQNGAKIFVHKVVTQ